MASKQYLYILQRAGILRRLTLSECSKNVESLNTSRAQIRLIHTASPCAAGHAKWQNIKHIKEANDKIKGQKSNFLSGRLQILFAKNPEKDPKLNTELANLIRWARTNNIPNDVIDRAIDREVKLRDPKNITVFDGRGLSNAGIIIECFALKSLHTKNLLQGIVKKYGFNLNVPAMDLFDYKGKISLALSETEKATALTDTKFLDKYVDLAIEAGAEDVKLEEDDDGHSLQFLCSPTDLDKVYKNLEQVGLQLSNSERVYIPKIEVPVTREYLNELDKLVDKLDIHPDVVNYYFNLVPES